MTILIVEQSAAVALEVADYGYVLENGRIVLDGSADAACAATRTSRSSISASRAAQRRSYRDVKQYRRSRRWYG